MSGVGKAANGFGLLRFPLVPEELIVLAFAEVGQPLGWLGASVSAGFNPIPSPALDKARNGQRGDLVCLVGQRGTFKVGAAKSAAIPNSRYQCADGIRIGGRWQQALLGPAR